MKSFVTLKWCWRLARRIIEFIHDSLSYGKITSGVHSRKSVFVITSGGVQENDEFSISNVDGVESIEYESQEAHAQRAIQSADILSLILECQLSSHTSRWERVSHYSRVQGARGNSYCYGHVTDYVHFFHHRIVKFLQKNFRLHVLIECISVSWCLRSCLNFRIGVIARPSSLQCDMYQIYISILSFVCLH